MLGSPKRVWFSNEGTDCMIYSKMKMWTYYASQPMNECMKALLRKPHIFGDNPCIPEQYECVHYSDSCLYITFLGGKMKRTEYIVRFHEVQGKTKIIFQFQHELFGFPPMTSVYTIDALMMERISAIREENDNEE